MSYKFEKLEHNEVKFDFEVAKDVFEKAIEKAYEQTKHKYAIPGFRKGHAPMNAIVRAYGKGVFFDDAVDICIQEEYAAAMEKEKELEVVAQPEQLDSLDFTDDGGIKFSFKVTVRPEVKLGKYKGLSVEKKVEKVTKEQIENEIKAAQEKQARMITSEDAAKMGNIVNIDFVGSIDGKEFEGGKSENFDLELGSGQFIPGFEEQLVGTKAGEEKDVNVKFPEQYQAAEYAGKDAVFKCKVNAVKIKELPELDDDFAKEASETANTLDEYKAEIKAQLEKSAENQAENQWMDDVVKAIVANAEVEVPDVMAKLEAEDMVKEFEYRLMYQGMKFDDYLKMVNTTREQVVESYKENAKETVRTRLVVSEIIQKENIQLEEAEIEAKIAEMAEGYGQDKDAFKKNISKEQIDYIYNSVLSNKFAEFIKKENGGVAKKAAAKKADKAEAPKDEAPAKEKKAPAKKATKKAE